MKRILKDGSTKIGYYKIKDMTLGVATKTKIISNTTKEKYDLNEIISLAIPTGGDSIHYEVINVKKYSDSKKTELKLGMVVFKGDKIEVFYVSEYLYQGGAMNSFTTVSKQYETYLRNKNDRLALNMGLLYGAAQRNVKKRLGGYFNDYTSYCLKLL